MNVSSLFSGLRRALFFCGLVLASLSLTGPTYAADSDPNSNPPFTSVCVIGDSLSDTGRTSAVLTQALGVVFPPPPYAAGRMSNGPVWIEYLTPMLRQNYRPLENFSWAGATTGDDNVFGPGLPGMLNQLTELRTPVQRSLNPNALYVVFGGANDFFKILSGANPNAVIPAGVANIVHIVRSLREAGAERIVVVDLPDIGLIPRVAAIPGMPPIASGLSAIFNAQLNSALDSLDFPVVRVSMFNLLHTFVANPAKYGFTNVTAPAFPSLGNAETYLFWDDVHPTTRAHRYVAEEVYNAVTAAGWVKHPVEVQ